MNTKSVHAELVSQFYRNNSCALFTAIIASILSGTTGLIVSWIVKELIDIISGQGTFTLSQILLICAGFIVFVLIITLLNYISEPTFVRRAMSQYKDKAFSFLSAKNISSFRDETTSTYLSALTIVMSCSSKPSCSIRGTSVRAALSRALSVMPRRGILWIMASRPCCS